VLSVYENLRDDVDKVRQWMNALKAGAEMTALFRNDAASVTYDSATAAATAASLQGGGGETPTQRNRSSTSSFSKAMSKANYFSDIAWGDEAKIAQVRAGERASASAASANRTQRVQKERSESETELASIAATDAKNRRRQPTPATDASNEVLPSLALVSFLR
jgi:hypothetical protein